ncbi:MAG: zinc ribbon domain-containing protein [Clostridia bacterium]
MQATMKFCQSCGMPMDGELYGAEADGIPSEDYCEYCYQNGHFTADCTMEEMIKFCLPHIVKAMPDKTEAQAEQELRKFFPYLKRWNAIKG